MKIIDLLNKIANGEEVPKKIKINNVIYEYRGYMYCTENANYQDIEDYLFGKWNFNILIDEVEIIEDNEEQKDNKKSNDGFEKLCETYGYLNSIAYKNIIKGWNKGTKEEKKIPEKIEYEITDENGEFSINSFTFDYEQKLQIIDTLNQVIDYLKSKGE